MANVFLAGLRHDLGPDAASEVFRTLAIRGARQLHAVTDSPEAADLVLFCDLHQLPDAHSLRAVVGSEVFRRHANRSVVYDERDRPTFTLPGIYVSLPAGRFHWSSRRTWSYHHLEDLGVSDQAPNYLFSFVGSPTHSCREPLFALRHPDAVIERVEDFMFWQVAAAGHAQQRQRFVEVSRSSQFVLCPRGHGQSSIRLYETMAAGRVPVIISDGWHAPIGPAWEDFTLRWPEGHTDGLVELLKRTSADAAEMGLAARRAFDDYFSERVFFDRCVDQLLDMQQHRPRGARIAAEAGRDAVAGGLRRTAQSALRR